MACSNCALVDIACDEAIDTTAYPELARHVGGDVDSYDDLDIEDVPADKIVRLPYGAVWKSTSVSGARWPRRAMRNRHRHAIEQVARRWRGGRREDSARARREF